MENDFKDIAVTLKKIFEIISERVTRLDKKWTAIHNNIAKENNESEYA